jgi:uncharacterized protein
MKIFKKNIPGNTAFWALLIAFFAASACKTVQKTAYAPDKIVPAEKSLLWKVSGNGLKKNSYVYGTIHLIPKSQYTVPGHVRAALGESKQVAFEIDMRDMTNIFKQLALINKVMMRNGKRLKDLLSAEDYAFVKEKMNQKGLSVGIMERIKPMFLSMVLTNDESTAAAEKMTSVEMELYGIVKKQGLASTGLETLNYQIGIFDAIPYETQAKMLVEGLRQAEEGDDEYAKMLDMYKSEDITAMQSMMDADDGGEYQELLLDRRNQNWIPIMGQLMKDRPTVFAVGAGHLGGQKGVIALLRKEGYMVEPVTEKK